MLRVIQESLRLLIVTRFTVSNPLSNTD